MSGKKSIKGELVIEILKLFPNASSKTLASKLYNENKLVFKSIEDARSVIRYYRGAYGKANRKVTDSTHPELKRVHNPFELPETDEAEWLPYQLPDSINRMLILSDIHIPYHNIESLTVAVQYGLDKDVDAIYLNGDIMDCYQLSRFCKDPRQRSFSSELEVGREFLKKLRDLFPNALIYYKIGNHEERLEAYLKNKAPELLDCSDFKLDVLLRFGELGIQLIDEKRIARKGHLDILHGHEFGRQVFSPVNPARGFFMRAKTTMIAGHHHQTSEHTEPNLKGDIITTWSTGCLCELHPGYMPINKWNHGFAYAEFKEDDFHLTNLRIRNGEIL